MENHGKQWKKQKEMAKNGCKWRKSMAGELVVLEQMTIELND